MEMCLKESVGANPTMNVRSIFRSYSLSSITCNKQCEIKAVLGIDADY